MATEQVRGILQSLHDQAGYLTPDLVVEAARPAESPLHAHFEWDNNVAADAYRRRQAAGLIRSVKITYADDEAGKPKKVRQFVSVRPTDAPDTRIYQNIEQVALDPVKRQMLLRDARRDWLRFKERYGMIEEFFEEIVVELNPGEGTQDAV